MDGFKNKVYRLPRHFVLSQATLGLLRSLIQSFPPRSTWKPVSRFHEKPQKSIGYHSLKQHGTGKKHDTLLRQHFLRTFIEHLR